MSVRANGKVVIEIRSAIGYPGKLINAGKEMFARITPTEVRVMYGPEKKVYGYYERFDHDGKRLSRYSVASMYRHILLRWKRDGDADWTIVRAAPPEQAAR